MSNFNFQIYLNGDSPDGESVSTSYTQHDSEASAIEQLDRVSAWAEDFSVTPGLALPIDLQPGEVGYLED